MANPFYQPFQPRAENLPPISDPSAGWFAGLYTGWPYSNRPYPQVASKDFRLRRRLLRRVLSVAKTFGARLAPGCIRGGASETGRSRDVLWQAKRNAFRRALSDHNLNEAQACRILASLLIRTPRCGARGYARSYAPGCELARLDSLSGLNASVLEQAVPLMGLQGFITVEQRNVAGRTSTILWVSATDHGIRYAAETDPLLLQRPVITTTGPVESHAGSTAERGFDA